MTNIRPISELSSIGNLNSNRSFETSHASTNSLVSSPSSVSVNNSIECKNENRWSKRASFPRLYLYLQMSKGKQQTFSPKQKNWKSGDSLEISTESFKYTTSSPNRCINDLDCHFLSPKPPVSSLFKSSGLTPSAAAENARSTASHLPRPRDTSYRVKSSPEHSPAPRRSDCRAAWIWESRITVG